MKANEFSDRLWDFAARSKSTISNQQLPVSNHSLFRGLDHPAIVVPDIEAFRKPPGFLRPGDVCRLEIEGIGVLENPVIAN